MVATHKPGTKPENLVTQEEIERRIQAEVARRLKDLQNKTAGWIIYSPTYGKKDKAGVDIGRTEKLQIHPHSALSQADCRAKKCKHGEGDCPTVMVESKPVDMFKGKGVTESELVAIWCRDYLGYRIERGDMVNDSLTRATLMQPVDA